MPYPDYRGWVCLLEEIDRHMSPWAEWEDLPPVGSIQLALVKLRGERREGLSLSLLLLGHCVGVL